MLTEWYVCVSGGDCIGTERFVWVFDISKRRAEENSEFSSIEFISIVINAYRALSSILSPFLCPLSRLQRGIQQTRGVCEQFGA